MLIKSKDVYFKWTKIMFFEMQLPNVTLFVKHCSLIIPAYDSK